MPGIQGIFYFKFFRQIENVMKFKDLMHSAFYNVTWNKVRLSLNTT